LNQNGHREHIARKGDGLGRRALGIAAFARSWGLGSKPPEGVYVIAARVLTFYFVHFLVFLPLLGIYERCKPIPASIYDAVLEQL
jgi:hypothetical protein